MQLKSPVFSEGGDIPSKYTCDGIDINPPLVIKDVPDNAKSLTLIVDDPDVPKSIREDGMWVHWTVFNIDPLVEEVEEDSVPDEGEEAMTNFGKPGYGGPCPPDGEHRYFFKLYALDTELDLSSQATKEEIEQAMEGHVIDSCELMGTYDRTE